MTIERALELLPQMRDSEWITALGQKTVLYTDEAKEAFNMAISALKKQKPVKVDSKWNGYYGKNDPCCGACGAYVDEYSQYCKRCGRPIDWSD